MEPVILTSSPHIHSNTNLTSVMYDVIIALTPALLVSIYYFGYQSLLISMTAVCSAVLFEAICLRLAKKKDIWKTAFDGSAIITGILLAMNLPPSSPFWMVMIGSFVAIVIAKQTFGGLGHNIFNPAMVARVFLLISFPVQMTRWTRPSFLKSQLIDTAVTPDALSAATPLGMLKTDGLQKVQETYTHTADFLGTIPGSLGEVSALALLIGAAYLLYRKVITWEIPVTFLGSLFAFTGIFWLIYPDKFADPVFHMVTGGAILGAFFMATDMVTSPLTRKGMLIFGTSIGLLTGLIRLFGGYPEGVSFAIVIMNAFVPLIDQYTGVRKFGS
ncbi:RnfABCDGE type electron transport complex subunit D [bacterium]|nr:RnfABCDGE type electron transport complex subunit D [candidate division CSSED10-310 bacterium]